MLDYRFLKGALADFDAAIDWYLERDEAAAENLRVRVEAAVVEIRRYPTRYARIDGELRSRVLSPLPYHVVYRVDETEVVIVAVAHVRRDFGYWLGRRDD